MELAVCEETGAKLPAIARWRSWRLVAMTVVMVVIVIIMVMFVEIHICMVSGAGCNGYSYC